MTRHPMQRSSRLSDVDLVELRRCLSYNPDTGDFTWLHPQSNRAAPGSIAGGISSTGYLRIGLGGAQIGAHLLAWLYMTGSCPAGQVDHINGIRADNRWSNLRDVPEKHNKQNIRKPTVRNTSGFLGVESRRTPGGWHASIRCNGIKKHLGVFPTKEEAHAAYVAAKRQLHPGCTL
jgi:hypothetical protein